MNFLKHRRVHRRWRRGAAAVAAALALYLSVPAALGAGVKVNGTPLSAENGWVENGTSYITLRAYSGLTGQKLTWNGSRASLTGSGLDLQVSPGTIYLLVNGRALYVAGGVRVVDGKLALPLRVLAQATGARLSWDGASGTAVLNTAGAKAPQADYNEEELYWLARIISSESKGEPMLGQIAVGNVVVNRVKDSRYPDTIKDVIFDTNYGVQFQPVSNGTIYEEPVQSAVLAAKMTLEGAQVVGDSLYFFAPALSQGTWIVNNATYHTTIGNHQFYQ